MTDASPVAWRRHAAGRMVAQLGVVEVGEVSPSLFPGSPVGAHWRVFLPGVQTPCPRPARDVEAGQRRVEHIVMDWIDAAALAPATARELAVRACRGEAKPVGFDAWPKGPDQIVFDIGVNSGPARGLAIMAEVMKAASKSPAVLASIAANTNDKVALVKAACARRARFYRGIRTFATFGKGWLRRNAGMEALAVKMCLEAAGSAAPNAALRVERDQAAKAETKAKTATATTAGSGTAATTGTAATDPASWDWWQWLGAGALTLVLLLALAAAIWAWVRHRERVKANATMRAEAAAGDPVQRWWRPLYGFELTVECAAFWAVVVWALARGDVAPLNAAINATGLLTLYWGARFAVLGVYVNGRSREKECLLTGQPAPTAIGQVVKAVKGR